MTLAVADTTLLSNFAHVRRGELPCLAFPSLAAPSAVLEEIRQGERLGLLPALDWSVIPIIDPDPVDLERVRRVRPSLDKGETACLAVALARDAVVITDDWEARQVALSLGLELSGTLGALILLIEQERLAIDEADQLLSGMISAGYRSPVRSIIPLLRS